MKKAVAILLAALLLVFCVGCGETVIVHCDACGAEIKTSNTNITEDWIIFCKECSEKMDVENHIS